MVRFNVLSVSCRRKQPWVQIIGNSMKNWAWAQMLLIIVLWEEETKFSLVLFRFHPISRFIDRILRMGKVWTEYLWPFVDLSIHTYICYTLTHRLHVFYVKAEWEEDQFFKKIYQEVSGCILVDLVFFLKKSKQICIYILNRYREDSHEKLTKWEKV